MMADVNDVMARLGAELLPRATPGVSAEAQVRELEALIKATLPDDYRRFLPQWGGALLPGDVLFPVSGEPPFGNEAILDVLFGLLPGNGYDVADNIRGFEGQLPADLLPVAQDPGGNLVCLGIRGPRSGRVYFWDHNGALFGRDNEKSVYPVADNWAAFLGTLRRG